MSHLTTPSGIGWHYQQEGEGELLLFLHGWGGNLRLWSAQAEYFSRKYKVIRFDLPGHGESPWSPHSFAEMIEGLETRAQEFCWEKINVVGSSLGGLVSLGWFDRFPQRFKRLVLVGALPKFLQCDGYPYGLEPQHVEKLRRQLLTDYPVIINIFFRSLFTRWEKHSNRVQFISQFSQNDRVPTQEALEAFLKIIKEEDLRGVLSKVHLSRMPVQIFNGTDDYICSKEAVKFLKSQLPAARVALFQDCGHFPFLTKPAEFNELLERFLNDT